MTPEAFIKAVKAGAVAYRTGGKVGSRLITMEDAVLDTTDLDALTAEGFNQDVFDSETTWDEARVVLQTLLADA